MVRGPDKLTYFFSDGAWIAHDDTRPGAMQSIGDRWALMHNRIARNAPGGRNPRPRRPDLFVLRRRVCALHWRELSVCRCRLSAPDCPGNLRREAPFEHLPAEIETIFVHLKPDDMWVSTACDSGGATYISLAGHTYALSKHLSRVYPLGQIAAIRNELLGRARVDAAFTRPDGAMFLLSGDQYVRYSASELEFVDDGYPRLIAAGLLQEMMTVDASPQAALPIDFQHDLDAALCDASGVLYLFKNKSYIRFDPTADCAPLTPAPIKGAWGRVANTFLGSSDDPTPRIDAAFVAPNGVLYVFKRDWFCRYTDPAAEFVDEGYPRRIQDAWGDLPTEFEADIDGGFVFEGRTYLCRGTRFVRYSDPAYSQIDAIYPQAFANRWRASSDYRLGDLRNIQRYVALDQSRPIRWRFADRLSLPTRAKTAIPASAAGRALRLADRGCAVAQTA